jgi:hypothetical protein
MAQRGGSCASPGAKVAGSFYSQWNGLKLADIGHERTLFLFLYSDLSPHGWICCGVGQRGSLRGAIPHDNLPWGDRLELTLLGCAIPPHNRRYRMG